MVDLVNGDSSNHATPTSSLTGCLAGGAVETAFAALPIGVVVFDAASSELPIVCVNPAFTRLTGYHNEEAVGRNFQFVCGPETDPTAIARVALASREGHEHTETLLNYRRDGTPFWNEVHLVPVRDATGGLTHVVGFLEDVTDRRWSEEAWARLDAVVESSLDAIITTTLSGMVTDWNQAAEQIYGYARDEIVGRSISMLAPVKQDAEIAGFLAKVQAGGHIEQLETVRVTKDGRHIDVAITMAPVRDSNGQIVATVTIARDITELRRVQEDRDRLYGELEAEFQRTAEIQAQLLPVSAPDVEGYEFAGVCVPARHVGGDFFDWLARDGLVRLSLGDVMGKGMPASLLTATVRAALRSVTYLPVSEAVEAVNRALFPDLAPSSSFITLFHASLNPASGEVTYVDAGHGLAFVLRRDESVEPLRQRGLPLGILPDAGYPSAATSLSPGDTLVIHSDGLPDARPDLQLDAAGVANHLKDLPTAQAKLERLVSLVTDVEARPDDLTLVLVSRGEALASRR